MPPKKSVKKVAKRSPAKKSPKKSPKARGRVKGTKLSSAKRLAYAKKRSLGACHKRCVNEVKMMYSPTKSQRAKASARRGRAASNPWISFMKKQQKNKPEDMSQGDWLKQIAVEYRSM